MTTRRDPAEPVLSPITLPDLTGVAVTDLDPTVPQEALLIGPGDPGAPVALRMRASRWLDVHWAAGRFDSLDLAGARLVRNRFTDVAAASIGASESTWRDVEVLGGRIGALELDLADLQSVRLEGCGISYLNLRYATVRDLVVTDCHIEELDLVGATLERARLTDCRVGQLSLHGATLAGVDLRGAQLGTVSGVDGLAGARITDLQLAELAGTLAEHLGILVGGGVPPAAAEDTPIVPGIRRRPGPASRTGPPS